MIKYKEHIKVFGIQRNPSSITEALWYPLPWHQHIQLSFWLIEGPSRGLPSGLSSWQGLGHLRSSSSSSRHPHPVFQSPAHCCVTRGRQPDMFLRFKKSSFSKHVCVTSCFLPPTPVRAFCDARWTSGVSKGTSTVIRQTCPLAGCLCASYVNFLSFQMGLALVNL